VWERLRQLQIFKKIIFSKMGLSIKLDKTVKEDLDHFFQFQLDDEANRMAAFTAKDPTDKAAYMEKYTPFLSDPTINMRTIRLNGEIVGSIAKFVMHGEAGITYWIDRKYWGQGIATAALREFLAMEKTRPIFGGTAFDNIASQKILEKCGFIKTATDKGFANARQMEIEEFIYKLDV
jgi:[ribosomal protein S5]-alanine N-acetyltransferase